MTSGGWLVTSLASFSNSSPVTGIELVAALFYFGAELFVLHGFGERVAQRLQAIGRHVGWCEHRPAQCRRRRGARSLDRRPESGVLYWSIDSKIVGVLRQARVAFAAALK